MSSANVSVSSAVGLSSLSSSIINEVWSYETALMKSCATVIVSVIVLPVVVHLIQSRFDASYEKWWTSTVAFRPSALMNVVTGISYMGCVISAKLIARAIVNKPIYTDAPFTSFDFFIVIPLLIALDWVAYIIHRVQHWESLYFYSHYLHHSVKYVGIWSSFYAHPLDYFSTTLPITLLCGYLYPFHWGTDAIITLLSTTSLVVIHSEYKNVSNGHHNVHHLQPLCNYSGSSPYIDKLMGTYQSPETYAAPKKQQ